jgi:hypothetical protein
MTMDELRRQLATIQWPIAIRVDSKDIKVSSPEDLMVPSAGNLICAYQGGAFEVVDRRHIATLRREKSSRRQATDRE